jgi:hypothetical protein
MKPIIPLPHERQVLPSNWGLRYFVHNEAGATKTRMWDGKLKGHTSNVVAAQFWQYGELPGNSGAVKVLSSAINTWENRVAQSAQRLGYGRTVLGPNPDRDKWYIPPPQRSVVHPTSHATDTEIISCGGKATGRKFNHLPPSSNEFKNEWRSDSTIPISLHDVDNGKSLPELLP